MYVIIILFGFWLISICKYNDDNKLKDTKIENVRLKKIVIQQDSIINLEKENISLKDTLIKVILKK